MDKVENGIENLFKGLFGLQPELIDVSWTQKREGKDGLLVDGLRFHIKQDYYGEVLDYPRAEIQEYLNKFGPITPKSLDWNNSINNFDILDLKKDTLLYEKINDINRVILTEKLGLEESFGINKKIVFSGEEFTITDL